jgi:hypothetical protein
MLSRSFLPGNDFFRLGVSTYTFVEKNRSAAKNPLESRRFRAVPFFPSLREGKSHVLFVGLSP